MESLANKYRPQVWSEVICQDNIKTILSNQIEHGTFKQGYLFCGGAGTGKTTTARIFARELNKGKGRPIEIDGASNNGVENIRNLITDCKMKSLDSDYKIYIIDECHMLSNGAWNAFLKVLEEPPKGVIFILCTTDPQKIPPTILSRVQRFDFKRIPQGEIEQRLIEIIAEENRDYLAEICANKDEVADPQAYGIDVIYYTTDAISLLAELADGGMRDAITKLDTVLGYSRDITVDTVESSLGLSPSLSIKYFLDDLEALELEELIVLINKLYMDGKDLRIFLQDAISELIKRSEHLLMRGKHIEVQLEILEFLLNLKYKLKGETNIKTLIIGELIVYVNRAE